MTGWLNSSGWALSVQTLVQESAYSTSLLIGTEPEDGDPSELEDTYERFSRFSGGQLMLRCLAHDASEFGASDTSLK